MIAVYIGLILFGFSLDIPYIIDLPLSSLSACTMPLTMLLVGSILSEVNIQMFLDKYIFYSTGVRVILIPAAVYGIALLLKLPAEIAMIATLMSGMPAGSTTGLMASKYGGNERLASAVIVVSTIAFLMLLPAWMILLVP
jgi:predicted permease